MTTLKEETIRGIRAEGAFNMKNFGDLDKIARVKSRVYGKSCGSPVCIAGHIAAAQVRLGRELPKGNIWGGTTEKVKGMLVRRGLRVDIDSVAAAARLAWAKSYGTSEANRLEFTSTAWGHNLAAVTPEEAIAHLDGAEPVRHEFPAFNR